MDHVRLLTQGVALGYVLLPLRGVLLASFDFTFALSDIIIKSSSLIQLKNEIVLTFVV